MHQMDTSLSFKAVKSLSRFCSRLVFRFASRDTIENDVLHFMAEDPYWHSAHNVWSKIKLRGVKSRNAWLKWRIAKAMRDLWKRGLLQRVPSKPRYYRITFA